MDINNEIIMNTVKINHNFDPSKFKWLWSKYVKSFNDGNHCTKCLRGKYSRKFSKKSNPNLANDREISFDEERDYKAIYLCGVFKKGYKKTNYPHNVHMAILPKPGHKDKMVFENWIVILEEKDAKRAFIAFNIVSICRFFNLVTLWIKTLFEMQG
ncbi:unnamed protein product [marine sediment metagenome]|uniref:Uncharacterized protein n=1 Tax=marine sediment metagenome TaxID=412755 RepID=X1DBR6_9ZZZZ